jgi:hypothetical protein
MIWNLPIDIDAAHSAFAYKLGAAKYHFRQLETLSHEHVPLIIEWTKNHQDPVPSPMMEIFYHLDAFIYQLYSCFDMILQIINIQHGLGVAENKVSWGNEDNKPFKKKLRLSSPAVYQLLDDAFHADWFVELKRTRDHLAHRGFSALTVAYSEENETVLLMLPGLSLLLTERCDMWGNRMAELYKTLSSSSPLPHV